MTCNQDWVYWASLRTYLFIFPCAYTALLCYRGFRQDKKASSTWLGHITAAATLQQNKRTPQMTIGLWWWKGRRRSCSVAAILVLGSNIKLLLITGNSYRVTGRVKTSRPTLIISQKSHDTNDKIKTQNNLVPENCILRVRGGYTHIYNHVSLASWEPENEWRRYADIKPPLTSAASTSFCFHNSGTNMAWSNMQCSP
jgi:hypothetical protein